MNLILEKLKNVKAFIFDVDGVMTDGSVIATEDGQFLRNFNIKDGYAIQHAVKAGYPICIISGGRSEGVRKRFQGLKVQEIYLGQEHKEAAFQEFLEKYKLTENDILYMGDDIPDMELIKRVLVGACPADAADDIKVIAQYISPVKGGRGCVRDVIEKTMKVQNKWWSSDSGKF